MTAIVLVALAAPRPALATNRDVKAVITTGEYGILGGTVLGLASLPFTRDVRSIFIGTSLGLYLGIAVGIYYITHRYDPDNPLRIDQRRDYDPQSGQRSPNEPPPPLARVDVPVARF